MLLASPCCLKAVAQLDLQKLILFSQLWSFDTYIRIRAVHNNIEMSHEAFLLTCLLGDLNWWFETKKSALEANQAYLRSYHHWIQKPRYSFRSEELLIQFTKFLKISWNSVGVLAVWSCLAILAKISLSSLEPIKINI